MSRYLARFMRRLAGTDGTNLVEAALLTPLLILLTFSIVDFGAMFYAYLALENGVSQAVRYGVTGNTMDDGSGGTMSRQTSIMTAMRQATPTLSLDDGSFSFEHMTPGSGSWAGGVGGPNDIDKVTVNYDWPLLTPVLRPFFPDGKIHLRVESAMKNEGRFE